MLCEDGRSDADAHLQQHPSSAAAHSTQQGQPHCKKNGNFKSWTFGQREARRRGNRHSLEHGSPLCLAEECWDSNHYIPNWLLWRSGGKEEDGSEEEKRQDIGT